MFAFLVRLKNLLGIGKELLAFVRQMNLFAEAVEKLAIQLPLQRLDPGGDGRLGQKEHIRRLVEAAVVIDVHKGFEIFDIQETSTSYGL